MFIRCIYALKEVNSMTQLSGAHAFHRFLRQLSTDFDEILYRTFPSHVQIRVKNS